MDMKINRLLEIIIILMNRGTVTAKELADRFQVSTRTIYRDIDNLSSAGVPVYMTKGNRGGIALLDNYSLSKVMISEQESANLLLALQTLQVTRLPEIDILLDKLGAIFKNVQPIDWVDIDFSHWGSLPNDKNKFNDIKEAILQRKVIYFEYVNANGQRSTRFVEPLKLFYKGASWYFVAYCRQRESYRFFRISRVKNVIITAETFCQRALPTREDETNTYSKEFIRLKLRFQANVINRLYDDFDDSFITKNLDGTLDVEVTFPEDEWIYGYILSFGSYVEVLEPKYLRVSILERLKQTIKKYEN